MRQRTYREKRIGGTICMLVGILEFSVGWIMWYSKIPIPLYWLFWTIGILLFFFGRKMRRGY